MRDALDVTVRFYPTGDVEVVSWPERHYEPLPEPIRAEYARRATVDVERRRPKTAEDLDAYERFVRNRTGSPSEAVARALRGEPL